MVTFKSPQDLLLRAIPLTEGIQEVGGQNRGRAVEIIQKFTGNGPGDAWCASFVARCGKQMLGSDWKLPKTASCDVLLRFAQKNDVLFDKPERGAVFLRMRTPTDAIHTGFVEAIVSATEWTAWEGNTNPHGGREGFGVFRRTRGKEKPPYKFIYWWLL